jgi:WD40 repeat protein
MLNPRKSTDRFICLSVVIYLYLNIVATSSALSVEGDNLANKRWEVKTVTVDDHKSPVGVGFVNGHVVAAWASTSSLSVWRLKDDRVSTTQFSKTPITALATSQSARMITLAGSDRSVVSWKIPGVDLEAQMMSTVMIPDANATCLCFSANGKYVAAGTSKGKVIVWQTDTSQKVLDVNTESGGVSCLLFDDPVSSIIVGQDNGKAEVWNLQSAKLSYHWAPHKKRLSGLSCMGHQSILSGGWDDRLILYDYATGITKTVEANADDDIESMCSLKDSLACYVVHYGLLTLRDMKADRIIFTDPFPQDSYTCCIAASEDGLQAYIACRKKLGVLRIDRN